MSLYSSIDVPEAQTRASAPRTGFVGLYCEPEATIPETISSSEKEQNESHVDTKALSDAVLQFAPKTRRKPVVPNKRKINTIDQSDSTSINQKEEITALADRSESSATQEHADHVPRLEVINTFDDYAEFVPDSIAARESRPRDENRKKTKKSKAAALLAESVSWNDDYDPSNPVDLDFYLRSDERMQARKDWQAYKQANDLKSLSAVAAKDDASTTQLAMAKPGHSKLNFAPPGRGKLNFAPSLSSAVHLATPSTDETERTSAVQQAPLSHLVPPPPPPPEPQHAELPVELNRVRRSTSLADVETAEEAYQRRVAMQSAATRDASHRVPPQTEYTSLPVYSAAPQPHNVPEDGPQARSNAPGQKGFASRYMAAQGWSKGQGLGSTGSGRLAPLFIKPLKDGKTGKIVDKHSKQMRNSSKLSQIVLLEGMFDAGINFDADLQQDIGDSCSQAYGKVERVKLDMDSGKVLVKFTDTISALRCISTVEGRVFNGKSISARYYDETDFEANIWTK